MLGPIQFIPSIKTQLHHLKIYFPRSTTIRGDLGLDFCTLTTLCKQVCIEQTGLMIKYKEVIFCAVGLQFDVAIMSGKRTTYNSRWVACRRKVRKFLESSEAENGAPSNECNKDDDLFGIRCGAAIEWEQIITERRETVAERSYFTDETCETTKFETDIDNPYRNGVENDNEDCWKVIDDAEIDFRSSDSDFEDTPVNSASNFRQSLAHWACNHNITHSALSDLLKLLKLQGLEVPQTAACLLKTPRTVVVENKFGGEYIYLGLSKSLSICLSRMSYDVQHNPNEIELHVNIDGLPLFKSSSLSVWPILCSISNILPAHARSKPFPVALYCGLKKPSDLGFLSDFIAESKILSEKGFLYNGKELFAKIVCVICDAPAKSFVKGIVQFNGKYGCDRCILKGEYSEGRMVFLKTDSPLRTDESFRLKTNPEHHKKPSPFCDLPLNMINDFPIDYMHLVNLGVTKRLMLAWTYGPLKSRLSSNQINTISMNLLKVQHYMPKEFARRPRSLQYLKMWKATEYRQFLLYTGPIVLKKVLTEECYVNFLCLSVGVSILLNVRLVDQHREYARKLLKCFVSRSADLFGKNFVTYNVHGLSHLHEVTEKYGSLEHCSAYPFENYMQTIKKSVRSTKSPLAQIVRRLEEAEINTGVQSLPKRGNAFHISANSPDNCFLLKGGKYCLCHEIPNEKNEVLCEVFVQSSFFYEKPCDSRLLGIHKVMLRSSVMKLVPVERFIEKAIFVRLNDSAGVVLQFQHRN